MPRACHAFAAVLAVAGLVLVGAAPASAATALDLLRAGPPPRFRQGHTLPRLTRWGWSMPPDVRIELAENWGYALELGEANAALVKQLADPSSNASKLAALAASDPKRYPLGVLVYRACNRREFQDTLPPETWCPVPPAAAGEKASAKRVWSPEAPDAVFAKAAAEAVEPLRQVLAKAPGAVILNGGEYGLGVLGFCRKTWEQDPGVVKARAERDWFDYLSDRKARQEQIVTDAVRRACPDRSLYIFYYADGNPYRGEMAGWKDWAWDYRLMKNVSDLPSASIYYREFNSGWTGPRDLLSLTLGGVAQHLALGQPLSYNWVCGGWTQEKLGQEAFSPPDRYLGFLKCYYTTGMIGGVAGYFAYPKGGFAGDVGAEPPSWLRQMMTLAEVHALFSHLEEFLREGDLLPGPDKHRWSKDLPAYEFPTGDPAVRVLARRHRKRPEWLITAWAAGGDDRPVEVTIPDLGRVRLDAAACGSVYRAALQGGRPVLTPVGRKGLAPTEGM